MARGFNYKNKDLVKLDVVNARDVWKKQKNGKYVLDKNLDIYGRISKGTSAFITTTNRFGENAKFIEDTHYLPKRTKNAIVDKFQNKRTSVVYLVKKK